MVILFVILIGIMNSLPFVSASTFDTFYARVMTEECYLYKNPINVEDNSNILFTLPKTYFVELVEEAGSEFYKVNYLSFSGYVKKQQVQTIVGTPKTPYLANINFRVYGEPSRDLRSEPNTKNGSSAQIVYVPLYSRNLTFYGTIKGEVSVEGRTNIWFYCKYSADKDYYGYIYSDMCDEIDINKLPLNTEEVTYCDAPKFGETNLEQTSLPVESKTTGIVIGILCVPALIFVFMIIKSSKFASKERSQAKEVKDF